MIQIPVKNFTKGREGHRISACVLHITQGSTSSTLNHFNNPKSLASAHYLVSPEIPYTAQLVQDCDMAWHAGVVDRPIWKGIKEGVNPNLYTIGIESVSPSSSYFPRWGQWVATARLLKEVCERHNIPLNEIGVLNHDEINAYKSGPGIYFGRKWMLILIKWSNLLG